MGDIEIWRPVVGWEDLYEVSDLGRVRSLDRMMTSPTAKHGYPRRLKGRVLKGVPANGYLGVVLHSPDGARKRLHVAHIVAAAFHGPRPSGYDVCHNDGCRTNNLASNLRYDTHVNNEADKAAHGTRRLGAAVPASKLTEEVVREIRRLSATTDHRIIAQKHSIRVSNVDQIAHRRAWNHLPVGPGEVGSPEVDALKKESIRAWRAARLAHKNASGNRWEPYPPRGSEGEPS